MTAGRIISHLCAAFSPEMGALKRDFDEIAQMIAKSEGQHSGQICFAVEPGLELGELFTKVTSRQRAETVFSQQRVWDTAENNGVLIYLLLAERSIEIVADRGINAKVSSDEWQAICRSIEERCRAGDIKSGVFSGIEQVSELLKRFFPADGARLNSVSDEPVIV